MHMNISATDAAQKGVAWLVDTATRADGQPVQITKYGQPVAMVLSTETLKELFDRIEGAKLAAVGVAADSAADRQPKATLEATCERLGVDITTVRARAAQLAKEAEA